MQLLENYNLKKLNTFGVEAEARWYTEIEETLDLDNLLNYYNEKKIQLLPLGCGSNILFTKNYEGLVAKINTKGIKIISEDDSYVILDVAAGELWEDLIRFCIEKGFHGLENLSGIPGQVGSSPIQNIGAYGVEVKDYVKEVHAISIADGSKQKYSHAECSFAYRDSIFKHELKGKVIITNVLFCLSRKPKFILNYSGVAEEVQRISSGSNNLASVSKAICNIRNRKIPDPKETGSAGSFFKNPQIDAKQFTELIAKNPNMVHYPSADKTYKLAAAWLIEQCGWKAYRKGDAGVNEKQPLILVNYGNAGGTEILELSMQIQDSVHERFGILLDTEVNII